MKVRFMPMDVTCEVKPGQSVLNVAQQNNIFIKSICGGVPSCAECRVNLIDGEGNVLQPLGPELALIGSAYFIDRRRLSCQLKCYGDITVDLTEQIEKEKQMRNPKARSRNSREESISQAVMGNLINTKPQQPPANEKKPAKPASPDLPKK